MNTNCEIGTHEKVVVDRFAKDIGGRRTPGDCYCLDCKQPIAAWWNHGKPVAIPYEELEEYRKKKGD